MRQPLSRADALCAAGQRRQAAVAARAAGARRPARVGRHRERHRGSRRRGTHRRRAAGQARDARLAGEQSKGRAHNGIDFRWNVAGAKAAKAACLSYSVWLPDKFDFGTGGNLPGIAGGEPDTPSAFGTRLQWRVGGEAELAVAPSGASFQGIRPNFALLPGRWTQVEQEVVLNTPGAKDGLARLWIDGKLRAEDASGRVPLRCRRRNIRRRRRRRLLARALEARRAAAFGVRAGVALARLDSAADCAPPNLTMRIPI